MTTPTLPGHGANWLRPCSPVIVTRGTYAGLRGIVVSIADGIAMVAIGKPSVSSLIALGLDDIALDLSDCTGQMHAGLWLWERPTPPGCDYSGLIRGAGVGRADPARLRLACLHVAGVRP